MSHKLILVEATHHHHDSCDECCEPDLESRDVSLSELSRSQNWEIQQEITFLLREMLTNPTDVTLRMLKLAGWVNIKDAKAQEDLVALKEYILLKEQGRLSGFYAMEAIDPSHITTSQANWMANGSRVVQVISKPSLKKLMDEKSLKVYNAASDRIKQEEEKRKQAKATKEEKRKLKEIEKARKLLGI